MQTKSTLEVMNIFTLLIQTMRQVRVGRLPAYACVCAAIAVSGSMARGDWPQYRFDPAHHGLNPNETILSPATVGRLTVKWRVSVGGGGDASATVVGGRVYVVRERANDNEGGGKLYALDKNTGQQLWSFPPDALAGDFSTTTPAVANGIVYFGVNRGGPVVYAVDAATGVRIWSHGGPISQIISSPTVLDGRVYVAFTDGTIRALDAATGQIIWSAVQDQGAYSSPAVASGRLYIALHNRGLLALDAANGATLWLAPIPGPQWSSPAVDNGRVFVGSRDDHKVYAFDAVTGQTLWTATTSDWVHSSPTVANGVVYIGNEAGDLYAFNAATGGLIWRTGLTNTGIFNGPTVANGVVYAAGEDAKLYAVEAATGRVLFRGSIDNAGQSLASPTVDGGTVYIPAYDQPAVTAFALDTPAPTPTPTATPNPTATPTPTPGQIALSAVGYKLRSINTVDLSWSGATSNQVNIYRDGVVRARTANDGFHTDSTGARGQATYRYKVCEAGTLTCSNEITVQFGR
jgi:outer membrane protein assembly factor BamB